MALSALLSVPPPGVVAARAGSLLDLGGIMLAFGRGQEVFGQGEAADHVYLVRTGAVRCVALLADGRRQIADFYLPGDIFGADSRSERRLAAEAVMQTTLIVVSLARLTRNADGARALALWRLAVGERERSQDHALTLGRRRSDERVASLLLSVAERLGGGAAFALPMSRQDMADYLGLTIETVSRSLTRLEASGLVDLGPGRAVRLLDRRALEALRDGRRRRGPLASARRAPPVRL